MSHALQRALAAAGFDPGPVDGDLGPKTFRALLNYTAGRDLGSRSTLLGRAIAGEFPKHLIVTRDRIIEAIAQMAHETGGFRHFVELGSGDGPDDDPWDDYLERYDFRDDLGNSDPGDGERYRGRGPAHLTGEDNYERYGARIGVDLKAHPERAAEPEIGTAIFCLYWSDRGLNAWADRRDTLAVSRGVNLGSPTSRRTPNGLADRQRYAARLRKVWP